MPKTDWVCSTKSGYGLRQFVLNDINKQYLGWINSSEVMRYSENISLDHTKESAKKYLNQKIKSENEYFFSVMDLNKSISIGSLTIYIESKIDKTFDMGYVIGDKNYWGKNAGTNAIALGFEFCFNYLKLRKHFGGITSTNLMARLAAKKLGIREYAKMKDKRIMDNLLIDIVLVEFDSQDWENIKKNYI